MHGCIGQKDAIPLGDHIVFGPAVLAAEHYAMHHQPVAYAKRHNIAARVRRVGLTLQTDARPIGDGGPHTGALDGRLKHTMPFLAERHERIQMLGIKARSSRRHGAL
jgi:hypothetical protein